MLSWLQVARRLVVLVDGSGKALGANLIVELAYTEDGKRTGADKRAAAAERSGAADLAAEADERAEVDMRAERAAEADVCAETNERRDR